MFKYSYWLMKFLLAGLLWVVILSVPIGQKRLFDFASSTILENSIVSRVEVELRLVWFKIAETARLSYEEVVESVQL